LEQCGKDLDDMDRHVVLQDGFIHMAGFMPIDIQQRVVDAMREAGVSDSGFYAEQFDGVKVCSNVMRMYLGSHWNTVTKTWEGNRGNLGGAPVADLPKFLQDMYSEAVKRANRELSRGQNKKRKLTPFPEGKLPTLGVVNFFSPNGTMQMHQDSQETKASIAAGHPVMGICIGDSCDFSYSTEGPSGGKKPKVVRLESGDVYLFGGESRLMWHGVPKVLPRSSPPSLRLVPGRLSVTLRAL